MADWLAQAAALLQQHAWLLWGLVGLSVVTLVLSASIIPVLIARLPPDYYSGPRPPEPPSLRWLVVRVLRNGAGAVLLIAGLTMLFLPGQGLLTILAGLALLEFPGKRDLELRILRLPAMRRLVGWIRSRAGVPPLELGVARRKEP